MSRSEKFVGTMPVRAQHQFDVGRLEEWMKANVPGFQGPLQVAQFRGGQSNPTFRLTAGDGHGYVVRRKPPGELLKSAHAVDREFRVLSALYPTDVPVAKPHALCEDPDVIGTDFYVMDFVEGRVLWDLDLPGMEPAERAAIYDAMNDTLARIHLVDHRAVGLGDFGREGNYIARQIARWTKQYKASIEEPIEAMERLIEWLPKHLPDGDETALVHGDYRLDNMILHPTEPRVLAVIDWEISTLGHPLADLSYNCMLWHIRSSVVSGLAGLDLAGLGIPSEEDYVAAYCRRTGRAGIDNWEYYLVFNMFRLAAIMQGIAGRVRQGTAASEHASDRSEEVKTMSALAWERAQKLTG